MFVWASRKAALAILLTRLLLQQISAAVNSLQSLELLDISNCRSLTVRVFDILSKTKPHITTLIVARGQDRPLDVKDPMISLDTLTKLDISGVQFMSKQSLQRLAEGCGAITRSFDLALTAVSHLHCSDLNLSSVEGTTDASMLPIFKRLPNLTYLDLASTEITTASLKTMGQYLTSLQSLIIKLNHGLQGDIGLAHVINANLNLQSLDVSNLFKMKDTTFSFLNAEYCPTYTNLQHLKIDLASEVSEVSLRYISKKFPELRSLSCTAFPGVVTPTLLEFSKNNTNLTKLWLQGTEGVSGEGMQAIFAKCTNLTCSLTLLDQHFGRV